MSITFEGYTFTQEEMHATVAARVAESRRVATLGPAALDELDASDILSFDMGRTLAIMDYYYTRHKRQ